MTNNLDYQLLDKELDKVKTKVFLGKNAAFLGPLMCSLNFFWSEDIKTACTNGLSIQWNPHWFLSLPPDTRMTVLMHELWHVALLHMIRRGEREPDIWNYAADIAINNMLQLEGYSFDGTKPWLDQQYGTKPAEEIYDELVAMPQVISIYGEYLWGHEDPMDGEGDVSDIVEDDDEITNGGHPIINKVVQATQAAKLAGMGNPDDGPPEEIETMLKRFLQPKLPWELLLFQFFNELSDQDFTWSRPDRRYQAMYLPSLQDEDNGLEHLIYYLDVSGSVSDAEVIRFNSEVKFIKEQFNPKRLTLVLFDDKIQREYEFFEEDLFEEVVITGRGGTDLGPVREHMLFHKPNAVVVFSDLCCAPMQPLPPGIDIPTIWVGVNASSNAVVHFGKLVHIRE